MAYVSYVFLLADAVGGLGSRLGGHYPAPPPPPQARYSPDFLDNHSELGLLTVPLRQYSVVEYKGVGNTSFIT